MLIENTILNLTEPATFSQRSKNLQGQAVEGGGGEAKIRKDSMNNGVAGSFCLQF